MDPLVYAGFVVAGGVFLLIDAYRNFASPLAYHPFELHPILRGVDVQKLCTGREWFAGYLFYSLLYLISYAIILSSAEVYALVSNAQLSLEEVGAIGKVLATEESPLKLGSGDYGKPIFVSAFLIAFFSIGTMKPIESTMRSLAHRLAGVPSGVYRTIQELRKVPYIEYSQGYPRPLSNAFERFLEAHEGDLDTDLQIEAIKKSLAIVDCLTPSIVSEMRGLHFPLSDLEKLNEMTTSLKEEVQALKMELTKLQPQENLLEHFNEIAARTANNTLAMFAVLYIRNNRSAMNVDENNPIDKVVKKIEQGYNPEQNSFAMALFFAALISIFISFCIYYDWVYRGVLDDPTLANKEFTIAWTLKKKEAEKANTNGNSGGENAFDKIMKDTEYYQQGCKVAERKEFSFPAHVPDSNATEEEKEEALRAYKEAKAEAEKKAELCLYIQQTANQKYMTDYFSVLLGKSFWDTFSGGLMVFCVAAMAMFGREVRREQNSWREWKVFQFPFLRMLGMSVLPCLVAVLAVIVAEFIQLYWEGGFILTQNQIIYLFENSTLFFVMHLGCGLIISFIVLILMDKHNDLNGFATFLIVGVVGSFVYIVYAFVVFYVSNEVPRPTPEATPYGIQLCFAARESLIMSAFPVFFILAFSFLLECTEGEDEEASKSVFSKFFHYLVSSGQKAASWLVPVMLVAAGLILSEPAQANDGDTDNECDKIREAWVELDLPIDYARLNALRENCRQTQKMFRIGVRPDVRPFSFKANDLKEVSTDATTGPLAQNSYSGYMIKICDAVLAEILTQGPNNSGLEFDDIGVVDIGLLYAEDEVPNRFEYLGEKYDILCDPATISNERRSGHIISAPLYLTGISYLSQKGSPAPGDACPQNTHLIGLVGGTNAVSYGIRAILDAGELPSFRSELIGYLRNGVACEQEDASEEQDFGQETGIYPEDRKANDDKPPAGSDDGPKGGLVKFFPNHSEAARAFCSGQVHYYVGDLEIITANIRTIVGCDFDDGTRTYTNDRYAIFGKFEYGELPPQHPKLLKDRSKYQKRMHYVMRFFEILAQKAIFTPSVIDSAFNDTFAPTEPSEKLEAFFWSIRGAPARTNANRQ